MQPDLSKPTIHAANLLAALGWPNLERRGIIKHTIYDILQTIK